MSLDPLDTKWSSRGKIYIYPKWKKQKDQLLDLTVVAIKCDRAKSETEPKGIIHIRADEAEDELFALLRESPKWKPTRNCRQTILQTNIWDKKNHHNRYGPVFWHSLYPEMLLGRSTPKRQIVTAVKSPILLKIGHWVKKGGKSRFAKGFLFLTSRSRDITLWKSNFLSLRG